MIETILWEYGLILLGLAGWVVIAFGIAFLARTVFQHVDMGTAILLAYLEYGLLFLILCLTFYVNPIRLLFTEVRELLAISQLPLRILAYILILLPPVGMSLYLVFRKKLKAYLDHLKYHTGRGAYKKAEDEWYRPVDFKEELEKRGLLFQDKDIETLQKMNAPFMEEFTRNDRCYFYQEGAMQALDTEVYRSSYKARPLLSDNDTSRRLALVYNALLYAGHKEEALHYIPVSRFGEEKAVRQPHRLYPFYRDCYVECKILFVDGQVYAVIGVSASHRILKAFGLFDRPYAMILSEKENITTLYQGRYYPYGGIMVEEGGFVMKPAAKGRDLGISYNPGRYPVYLVEHVDRETINKIGAELQSGILSEAVKACFEEKEE